MKEKEFTYLKTIKCEKKDKHKKYYLHTIELPLY